MSVELGADPKSEWHSGLGQGQNQGGHKVRGGPMSFVKWLAWFVVVLLVVVALAVLGLSLGGLPAMFALLFLGLVAEGAWVWWRVRAQRGVERQR